MSGSSDSVVVVLAHAHDTGALAVARAAAGARCPVRLVRPSELARTRRWSHRIDPNGVVESEVELASGLRLPQGRVACVLDRAFWIPLPRFARAPAQDRDYAAAEVHALLVSWLAGLGCPVINPSGGEGPIGSLSRRQWLARAVEAGIPVARTVVATSARLLPAGLPHKAVGLGPWPDQPATGGQPLEVVDDAGPPFTTILVAGSRAYGELVDDFGEACLRVSREVGCPLLQFEFGTVAGEPALLDVNPAPPLLDARSVTAVASLLTGSRGAATVPP